MKPIRDILRERELTSLITTHEAEIADGDEQAVLLTSDERDEIVASLDRLAEMDAQW